MSKKSYPCILLLNDIHISKSNIPEFIANWQEAIELCVMYGIKIIAMGGDLFMSRSAQTLDVLLTVHDALAEAEYHDINIYLANGNHDKVNQEAIRGYCHVFDKHPNVTVVDEFLSIRENNDWRFVLHMIPYFPEKGSFTQKLEKLTATGLSNDYLHFLYVHQDIQGALSTPTGNELPINLFRSYDKVLVGHFHNRCTIKGTGIEYIGSSRQYNFGEDDQKGYTIIYSDGETEFHTNQTNVRYKVIDVPQEKVNIHLTDQLDEIKEAGRYKVKVRIHSTGDPAQIDKQSLLEAGASKVEIIQEESDIHQPAPSSLFERFDTIKIRESYKEFCAQKEIEDDSLGLDYLSKIEQPCGS